MASLQEAASVTRRASTGRPAIGDSRQRMDEDDCTRHLTTGWCPRAFEQSLLRPTDSRGLPTFFLGVRSTARKLKAPGCLTQRELHAPRPQESRLLGLGEQGRPARAGLNS